MKSCLYYAFEDGGALGGIHTCSRASEEYPLFVNCTGRAVMEHPFTTDTPTGRADYYLLYVEQGSLEVSLPRGAVTVSPGELILFPPHYPYRYTCRAEPTLSYLWVHFTGSYAARFLGLCGFGDLPCVHATEGGYQIVSGFRRMFAQFEAGGPLLKHQLACTLEQLLLSAAASVRADGGNRSLERSLGLIHSSYHKELRVPELAKLELLSNSRYITLFKLRTGLSPSEYIIHLRINAACDLLQSTDMTVKQIAAAVGYSDPHFFSKLFKRKLGLSPIAYREQHQ